MTHEELREACEMAGLVRIEGCSRPSINNGYGDFHYFGWERKWIDENEGECVWHWYDDDPALPAYVASLVVEQVRDMELTFFIGDGSQGWWECEICDPRESPTVQAQVGYGDTMSEACIRAAIAVLKESSE